jgi:PEP-CTERM motif
MKRIITTILSTCTAGFLVTTGAGASPITGPGGEIVSAISTITLVNNAGGCTGVGAAGCTIDGDISGSAGTFVEWLNLPPQFNPTIRFTYTLDQAYDVTRFLLWNDRGAPDSGFADFDLTFKDPGGSVVGLLYSNSALANQGSNPIPEVFNVGLYANVKSIELRVTSVHVAPGGYVQFREVEFDGTPVPEPASVAVLALGALGFLARGKGRTS